jgi:nucleoside-diphosphate-sugar epimerase
MGTMSNELVLVTGGSGFVGVHCILQLLEQGYSVRTTVRSAAREADVRSMLATGGVDAGERLSFAVADLASDDGWANAAVGCSYVLHVASPFPLRPPKHEDELIIPAHDGALRVLRAARAAGVRRVVMTSSFAAIGYGHPEQTRTFDERDWTDPRSKEMTAYVKSKAVAERAAWDFINAEPGGTELTVVNPVGIFGPVLGPDFATSIQIVKMMLEGKMPGCPRISFGVVDVRDVADLHLRAMTNPAAAGERFLAVAGESVSMVAAAKILRAGLGDAARRTPTRELPDWAVRQLAVFDSSVRGILPELGKRKSATHAKARQMLGWSPRPNEEAILATGESLVRLGLVSAT